jgi:hypothetical protein
VACLEAHSVAILPPDDRTTLGIHEPLLKDAVEDVLEVEKAPFADIDKLRSHLLVRARCLVISNPESGSAVSWRDHICVKKGELKLDC